MKPSPIATLLILALSGCTQTSENEYWCSYKKTEAAYRNCMEVAEGIDEQTIREAGEREDD